MADTEDLKSSALNKHESSSLSSGTIKLMRAHVALLDTLGASKNLWIRQIHKNALAYYETWRKEYEPYIVDSTRTRVSPERT